MAAVNDTLKIDEFKTEIVMCSTKLRWEIGKEEQEMMETEDAGDAATDEENEGKARLPFDPEAWKLDLRKRKVGMFTNFVSFSLRFVSQAAKHQSVQPILFHTFPIMFTLLLSAK